ncbi:hypothetical protein IKS86_04575 [bacterium]|nr:hypothetical protein [bacterium]
MRENFIRFVAENITIDDMPSEDMKVIAESCGVETALNIMRNLPGARFFVPVNWQKIIAEKYIAQNADKSVKALALDTGFSDWMVLKVLNKKTSEIGVKTGQTTVFDYIKEGKNK